MQEKEEKRKAKLVKQYCRFFFYSAYYIFHSCNGQIRM